MKRTRLSIYDTFSNEQIDATINKWIHDERKRLVLHYKLVDGLTYEEIAEIDLPHKLYGKIRLSPKRIQEIVFEARTTLYPHLKDDT
mgnify:CR=1 FL=1